MEYRVNRATGDRISVIGLGTSYICDANEREAVDALTFAYENGVNHADLATAKASTFAYYGTAFASVRKSIRYYGSGPLCKAGQKSSRLYRLRPL